MTHLTPDQFVDALDGTLAAGPQSHLDACDACRAELASMRAAVTLAGNDAADEPPPVFWTELEARVRDAVDAAAPAAFHPWWAGWRLAAAATFAIAALGLAIWMQWASRLPDTANHIGVGFNLPQSLPSGLSAAAAGESQTGAGAGAADAAPIASASAAANSASGRVAESGRPELPDPDVLVTPQALPGTAVTLEQLSERELREFVRLLKAEMGGM